MTIAPKKLPRCEICGEPVVSFYTHRCRVIDDAEKLADAVKAADQFLGIFPPEKGPA